MINPSCSTGSYTNSDSLIPEEYACKIPAPDNLDVLLRIIEQNRHHWYIGIENHIYEKSPLLMDANCLIKHNKWSLKICEGFTSMIDSLLNSFANKLAQINCEYEKEKVLFLSEISKSAATQPFVIINRLIEHIITTKIKNVVNYYAEEKRKSLINTGSKDYHGMKKVILEISEKTLSDESIISKLTKSISDEICYFHKRNYLKEKIGSHVTTPIKENIFNGFTDLYISHIEENYGHIISKSIDIFNSIVQDKECHMSFAFDTVLGHMVYHDSAATLSTIICDITESSVKKLRRLTWSRKIEIFDYNQKGDTYYYTRNHYQYSNEMKEFFSDSEKKLKEEIEKLTESDIIVLDGDVITTCKKEFREKLINSALRYLRLELHSCFNVE
ncbi:hypothetical protein [Candidatus Ichthyocystis hellenicum]|uniref:hypothetical protein n=1 Tax=Candidatus Ichthyocystis hellenicum TaxID=1561003 RepID=UPI000B812B87|nr:hypothetical protein [Candidatus Ichthyocystis hellenicum]